MIKTLTTAALFAASATFATAETISLEAPKQAASLHKGGVDMVVYYLEQDDHFEVVATYADKNTAFDPARMQMALGDGDAVTFGLPGLPLVAYGFARRGDQVNVTAEFTDQIIASAK